MIFDLSLLSFLVIIIIKSKRSLILLSSFNDFFILSSGLKVESPTFVITALIEILRLDLGKRLLFIGKEMNLVLMAP